MVKERKGKAVEQYEYEGDNKKPIHKKKKRAASPSSPEPGDGAAKRRRKHSTLEEEPKRDRKDKTSKSNKSSKHRQSHRIKSKDHKSGGGEKKSHKHSRNSSKSKFQELSDADYFSKNNEFATWLKEEKKLFFSDLSSESARDLFSEFVVEWNDYKLKSQYYEGIATGTRTSHKWNIKA